jgi:hypothetical protein
VFSAASGNLAASVRFEIVGGNLQVTLTNTSAHDVLVPADVLTAVFFDTTGTSATLAPVSAVLAPGSEVLFGGTDPGGVVGGEWAYKAGLSGAPWSATRGISSAGFGLFGPEDRFPGSDLQPPASPDGVQYGITSAGDDITIGNPKVTGSQALIQNSVVFTLSCAGNCDDLLASISNISFQYGTRLGEPNLVPEPAFTGLITFAGVLYVVNRRRAKRA